MAKILYTITLIGIIVFSFYVTNLISTFKDTLYVRDSQIANVSIENYELKEIIKKTASFDIPKNDSILRSCFSAQFNNTLLLRLTEDVCMNCYFNTLQRAISTYRNGEQKFDFKILGKYRFDANLKNDIKDFVSSQIETINSSTAFSLDELSAPYLLFLDDNGNLSNVYVLLKNDAMNFNELYSFFN